jgi:MFS family permease
MTMDNISKGTGGIGPQNFTKTNGLQLSVSFVTYLFDILSFIIISFIAVPFGKAIYPGKIADSLLVVWGGFAAGAVLRPLGAAIVGPLYDKVGRKRGIAIGLIGTTIFTGGLGLLPTYSQVGVWSAVIYIVLRLVAGLFIGALVAGGLVFTTENLPEKMRGIFTGLAESGANWAHFLGAAWLIVISVIFVSSASYDSVGWRYYFAVVLIPFFFVLPFLYFVKESDIFTRAKRKKKTEEPVYGQMFGKKNNMRKTFMITIFASIGILGYDNLTENQFPTFLVVVNKVPHLDVATLVLLGALGAFAGSMIGGWLSQKTGRKVFGLAGLLILAPLSLLFLYLGGLKGTEYYTILLTILPFYFFPAISKVNLTLFLNETYVTGIRSTGVGLNWNLGYGIASVWPLFITYMYGIYGISFYAVGQAIFLAVLAVVSLIAFAFAKETIGNITKEEHRLLDSSAE